MSARALPVVTAVPAVPAVTLAHAAVEPQAGGPIWAPAALPRKLSCGIVIVNDAGELLLCHVTGQDHWDLPKGGAMPGEQPVDTALRETREETGLVFGADELLELGRLPYRARKDLHLYAARRPRLDTAGLVCESRFAVRDSSERLPEMDGYAWVPFAEVPARVPRKLAAVLCGQIDLPAVLRALQAREGQRLAA